MKEVYSNKIFANVPINEENFGKVYAPSIRDIFNFGENEYYYILNLLMSSLEDLENSESLGDDFLYFDYIVYICIKNKNFEKTLCEYFTLLLKEKISFNKDLECFVIGKIDDETLTTNVKTIDRKNFDILKEIIATQNLIKLSDKTVKKKNKNKTKKDYILEKRKKGRENLSKAKGEVFSLTNFVLNLVVFYNDIEKVLDLNFLQANKIYEKFIKKENYDNEYKQYLAGADISKLSINTHWSTNK